MTGFGRGEEDGGSIRATVEVRSVNQRFLNVSIRMPAWLSSLEPAIREAVGAAARRGQIDVSVDVSGEGARPRVSVDTEAVANYLEEWRRVQRELDLHGDLTIDVLSASADLTTTSAPAQPPDQAWPVIEAALSRALERLGASRAAEGHAMTRDLLGRVEAVEAAVARIEERAPEAVRQSVERLAARVAELLEQAGRGGALPEDVVAREVALLAEKSDVAEEISRLRSHIEQVREVLSGGGEAGRRLEFLVQEMVREVNTIGSKSADAEIARDVVEMKAEIERVREQARNVE